MTQLNLWNILIIFEVTENLKQLLEEQSWLPVLPAVGVQGEGGHAPHQHVQVVLGGDGRGQVLLGCVQLLNVPGDFLHHGLALPCFILDISDLTEQLDDG